MWNKKHDINLKRLHRVNKIIKQVQEAKTIEDTLENNLLDSIQHSLDLIIRRQEQIMLTAIRAYAEMKNHPLP